MINLTNLFNSFISSLNIFYFGATFITFSIILYKRKWFLEKYNKIKQLNQAIKSTDPDLSKFSTYKKTCSIIFTMIKDDCKNYFYKLFSKKNYTKKLDKKNYEVSYNINDKHYKFIVSHSSRPHNLSHINNEKGEDITNLLLPYLGPEYNWHNTKLTPNFFGYSKLVFYHLDGTETIYDSNTVLQKV